VSRYHKGKTNLDFTEARDSGWQWHQLGCLQVCTSLQPRQHHATQFYTGRMPFLPPSEQWQSTEGGNRSISPARPARSSKPTGLLLWARAGTDRQTDGHRTVA